LAAIRERNRKIAEYDAVLLQAYFARADRKRKLNHAIATLGVICITALAMWLILVGAFSL
jgi:hypothetical protein